MLKNKYDKPTKKEIKERGYLCDNLNFVASEAYKLLRTNLMFSMPEQSSYVIGVTSSVRGEGKSTTSVNLAYTFAQSGKKVLLIDADMRLPSVAKKLGISCSPGLSNIIAGVNTGENKGKSCYRKSKYFDNWYILPAGDIPPNPSELLGSDRMKKLLETLKERFDVIVVDLPPVNIVSDALVISKITDGLAVVVRQGYTNKHALAECMYQVGRLDAKFLGFIMADADISETSYKHYKRYGGYDYKYYGSYSSSKNSVEDDTAQAFISAPANDQEIQS